MSRNFDSERYENMASQVDYLNEQLEALQAMMDEMDDEEAAYGLYSEEYEEIESMISNLESDMASLKNYGCIA